MALAIRTPPDQLCKILTQVVTTLEKAMAPHSSALAWKIPWTEEPDRLQSMGSLRARHDWATSLSLFTFMHWRRKWQPTPVSCLENPRDGGAWWAAICGIAQSQTRLQWLSSSNSSSSHHFGTNKLILQEDSIALFLHLRIICFVVCLTKPCL